MSLQSTAQELIVMEGEPMQGHSPMNMSLIPLEVVEHLPEHHSDSSLEICEPGEIEIIVEELPGAPSGTHDPEPLEVMEKIEEPEKQSSADENDAKKSKKSDKWDWESKGAHGFVAWIKTRIEEVPKHSGYDSAGLERAMSFLERLDNEISRAMRLDLDGELDANKIEAVRSQIDEGLSRLHDRLDKVKKHSKSRRKKKSDVSHESLIKEAQKITGVQGIYVVAPLLISRIARVCINGMISGGHSLDDLFVRQAKKYKLTEREQVEVMQLLSDMGHPLRQDRGYLLDDEIDESSSNNFDWSAQYKA